MVTRLTVKREGFVREVATGATLADAYRAHYDVRPDTKPETVWSNASRIMADSKVTARLAEIQQQAASRTIVTIQSITAELDEARAVAIKLEQSTAMTAASLGKAKVNGLLVDKLAHTSPDGSMSPSQSDVTDAIRRKHNDG